MITGCLHGDNRRISKTILRMYPSSFAATFTVSLALMMDTILAGAVLGQQTIINGSGIKMVQKLCRRIDYSYVYRMNILTIDVNK